VLPLESVQRPDLANVLTPIVCRPCIGYSEGGVDTTCKKRVIVIRTAGLKTDRCNTCLQEHRKVLRRAKPAK
jgi:AhpD family alkylhydroperoxidase